MEKLIPKKGTYIIMVRSYSTLAKIIRFGMKLEMFFKNKKGITFNHSDILIDGMVSGAIAEGVANRTVNTAYLTDGKRRDLYIFKIKLSKKKKDILREFCLDSDNKKYEYLNFFWHALKIFRNKWFGKYGKQSEKRVYCIEYVALGLNKVFPNLIEKTWYVNPTDLYELCVKEFQLVETISIPKHTK